MHHRQNPIEKCLVGWHRLGKCYSVFRTKDQERYQTVVFSTLLKYIRESFYTPLSNNMKNQTPGVSEATE